MSNDSHAVALAVAGSASVRQEPLTAEAVTADQLLRTLPDPTIPSRWGQRAMAARVIAHRWWSLALALGTAAFLRFWHLGAVGFNSDEAVYAGQAASIAEQPAYLPYFPIFRAHPLLFQSMLSLPYRVEVSDTAGRTLAACFGVATVVVVYLLGRQASDHRTGVVAASLLAVMPYHVTISRQVLLDGPMVFFATVALFLLTRFCSGRGERWLIAAGAALGLAAITKETAVILAGGIYCFFMVTDTVSIRLKAALRAGTAAGLISVMFPLAIRLAGASHSSTSYLAWQLARRANHPVTFYLTTVPQAMGPALLAVAGLGLAVSVRHLNWPERLLLAWCAVPFLFFTMMPIKGFQYLLPLAPALCVLAARTLTAPSLWKAVTRRLPRAWGALQRAGWATLVISLLVPAWLTVQPSTSRVFLAGTGGLPGGREAGTWVEQNLPHGSTLLTLGPSMANVIAFYGHRQAYALSVSPNPLNRNPSYAAVDNADLELRTGRIQYAVWDSFSAARSPRFSDRLLAYVRKYNGRAIHSESIPVTDTHDAGGVATVITIYELHP